QWDLVCENRWISFTITTVQMAGALTGAFIVGYSSDRFGRRISLYTTQCLHLIFIAVSAFSNSWQLFAAMRFGTGMVGGATVVVSFPASMEFVGKKWRALLGAFPVWPTAAPFLALITYLYPNWRHFEYFICIVNIPILLGFFIAPESIRWLTVKGRIEEASKVACLIAKRNKKPPPNTAILDRIAEEERSQNRNFSSYSFIDLFRGKRMALITLRLWHTWFTSVVVYWCLILGVQNMSGNFYINFFLVSVIEIPAALLVLLWINKKNFGRRWSVASGNIVTSLGALGAIIATLTESSKAYYVNICVMISKFATTTAWSAMVPFTAELYPTVIRNLGFGCAGTASRVGGIVASQVMLLGGYMPYIIICILTAIDTCLILTLPETRGEILQDTLVDINKNNEKKYQFAVNDDGSQENGLSSKLKDNI
ncbi:hypothetical protein LOTGIDRAFT_117872, partial [Lottia gigantea]